MYVYVFVILPDVNLEFAHQKINIGTNGDIQELTGISLQTHQ
jgi:hypothetical protein